MSPSYWGPESLSILPKITQQKNGKRGPNSEFFFSPNHAFFPPYRAASDTPSCKREPLPRPWLSECLSCCWECLSFLIYEMGMIIVGSTQWVRCEEWVMPEYCLAHGECSPRVTRGNRCNRCDIVHWGFYTCCSPSWRTPHWPGHSAHGGLCSRHFVTETSLPPYIQYPPHPHHPPHHKFFHSASFFLASNKSIYFFIFRILHK